MSYNEYNDLFLKCQDSGKYHVFTFDIVGSKEMDDKTRYDTQILLIELAGLMYLKLFSEETKRQKRILVFDDDFCNMFDFSKPQAGFGIKIEPYIFGDMFAITIYRNSLTNEEVIDLFKKCKKMLGLTCRFHIADGYYETNNYGEGNSKYFRGYCIQLLSELHKPQNKHIKKLLKQRGTLEEKEY